MAVTPIPVIPLKPALTWALGTELRSLCKASVSLAESSHVTFSVLVALTQSAFLRNQTTLIGGTVHSWRLVGKPVVLSPWQTKVLFM